MDERDSGQRGDPESQMRAKPRRTLANTLGRLAVVAVLTYGGVSVLVSAFQSRLIYFPTREYLATPADVGLDFQAITLRTDDGVAIQAWYLPHDEAIGSVVFCHGNAGNISDRLHTLKLLHGMSLNVLIFDYRGYGQSEGKPSEQGTYKDARAAYDYLVETRTESSDRIILMGRSLGGAVAVELATHVQPRALVVESTFTNLADVGRIHYPLLPIRWILTYRYDSIEKIPSISCPKLFIHGRDDTLIPLHIGRRLFEAASEPKQFLETPGGHNDGGFTYSPEMTQEVAKFIRNVLQPKQEETG